MGEDYDKETTNIHEFLASSFFSAYVTIIRVVMGTRGENSGESDCTGAKGVRVDRMEVPCGYELLSSLWSQPFFLYSVGECVRFAVSDLFCNDPMLCNLW